MKIKKVTRKDKTIEIVHIVKGLNSIEDRDITYRDAPLPSFDEALQGLAVVVVGIMKLPKSFQKKIKVKWMSVGYTKADTRSVTIGFDITWDHLDEGKEQALSTLPFRIEEAESGRAHTTSAETQLVLTMLGEVDRYVNGERQQFQLGLGPESEARTKEAGEVDLELESEEKDWSREPVVVHPETDIPHYAKMVKAQSIWIVKNETDVKNLLGDLKMNFDEEMSETAPLGKVQEKLISLIKKMR